MSSPADWQLPSGVSRAVWEYTHDSNVAKRYDDELTGTKLLETDHEILDRVLDSPGRVLDLGCGTGRIAIPLAERGLEVIGLDLSEPMLRVGRQKPNGPKVNWLCGNAVQLPFAGATFDAVTCMFATLGMISGSPSRQKVLFESSRVLRPGGLLVIHVHNVWHHIGTGAGRRLLVGDVLKRLTRHSTSGDFPMPSAHGNAGWTMHCFTKREFTKLVTNAGFSVDRVLGLGIDGREMPFWNRWRSYGFIAIAHRKPRP